MARPSEKSYTQSNRGSMTTFPALSMKPCFPLATFTAALMGQMLHMQVDIFSTRPLVQLLFVVAALIGVMSRMDAPLQRPDATRRTSEA